MQLQFDIRFEKTITKHSWKGIFDACEVIVGITMGLLNIALNIHVIIILLNVLMRKQQKMRKNDRNWKKKK